MAGFATYFRDQLPPATADEFDYLNARLKSFLGVSFNEDGSLISVAPGSNLVPLGAMMPFAGTTAPANWFLCDGTAISRVTYGGLFTVIGVSYGTGDGATTFNLPDLRQRFPLGKAASGTGSTLAGTGGAIDHVHTGPSHTHTGPSHTHTGPSHTHTVADHQHSVPSLTIASESITGATTGGVTTSDGSHNHGGATGSHNHGFGGTTSGPSTNLEAQQALSGMPNYSLDSHTHTISGTTGDSTASVSSDGAHTHSIPWESISGSTAGGSTGTGTSGLAGAQTTSASGTGNTGADGTENTGASGTGNTGTANAPFISVNYIILARV
jgi:microcystin-dependent protein